ncbi:MAG: TetR/AcrR family transcriptional regulator [Sphingomonadaceae bacterium]|nr:TetR/AcrR family transcriptional regulator [Sphingomonadaceae bacterium]
MATASASAAQSNVRAAGRPQHKRDDIIRCAKLALASGSIDDMTVADIVARSGIAQGTFYYHFPTKADLLSALIGEVHREILALTRGAAGAGLDLAASIAMLMSAGSRIFGENRHVFKAVQAEALLRGNNEQAEERDGEILNIYIAIIEREQRAGRVAADLDPAMIAHCIHALLLRYAGFEHESHDDVARHQLADHIIRAVRGFMTEGSKR